MFLAASAGPGSALLALVLCWYCECFEAGKSCFGFVGTESAVSCFAGAACTGNGSGTAGDFTACGLDLDTGGAGATRMCHRGHRAGVPFAGTGGSSGTSGACGNGGGNGCGGDRGFVGPGGASGESVACGSDRGNGRDNRRGVRLRLRSLRLPMGALSALGTPTNCNGCSVLLLLAPMGALNALAPPTNCSGCSLLLLTASTTRVNKIHC